MSSTLLGTIKVVRLNIQLQIPLKYPRKYYSWSVEGTLITQWYIAIHLISKYDKQGSLKYSMVKSLYIVLII